MSSSFLAGGNIPPSRFVSLSTTLDRTLVLSASGDLPVGISQLGTHLVPALGIDDGYAAVAGENVRVYTQDDEEAWLELSGTVAPGDLIKPDLSGNGTGIKSSADGDNYGARAYTNGVSGQIVKVKPLTGQRGA